MYGDSSLVEKHRKNFSVKLKYFKNGQPSQRSRSLSKDSRFNQSKNFTKIGRNKCFEAKAL